MRTFGRSLAAAALALALWPAAARAEHYKLTDTGDFAPAGHRVEFADRFGWASYKVDMKLGLDQSNRALTPDSKLTLRIERRRGRAWTYVCRAKGRGGLTASVNFIYGKGISVLTECRIFEKDFAKAVDLDYQDVGIPTLVFQIMIQDGQVRPGAQRGIYFLPSGQIESSELATYASAGQDGLAVVFRSRQ
jgi:hypothetical protein